MEATRANHPCFNKDSVGTCGRVHLPVAPKCNVLCSYCNRKYDSDYVRNSANFFSGVITLC